ncbi:MAG TPA: hypothetical protein PLS50_08730 [Candidatus Dojkabacteria bacterium]|nr:hypothetical protein [Candidatus Dojkabacteria bacterium]
MGVDYHYCGTCRESLHADCFRQCYYEGCCELFENSSGHGYICEDCIDVAVKKNEVFKSRRCDDAYFCSKECRNEWIKEFKERAKDIRKCEVCNKEGDMNTLFESQEWNKPRHVYCSYECNQKAIRKCEKNNVCQI